MPLGIGDERGLTLIELLVAMAILIPVLGATMSALLVSSHSQRRDQAFAEEFTTTGAALAGLTHDLRQATTVVAAQPARIEFLMPSPQVVNGQRQLITLDIRYDCTAADSVPGYTRCARVQSVYPNPLPALGANAGPEDIEHVANGAISSYCNATGSAQSGSVFFYTNPNTANPDTSPPPCDQNYENVVAQRPDYVQVLVRVPAGGSLRSGGMTHQTVLSAGAYLRNWNLGA